jgi:hypothetical protein
MMADNAGFVVAAYVVTAICLAAYWRFLRRRDKELSDRSRPR